MRSGVNLIVHIRVFDWYGYNPVILSSIIQGRMTYSDCFQELKYRVKKTDLHHGLNKCNVGNSSFITGS